MIDRQSIETTVQQIADGEISLQQATEQLLGSNGAESAAPHPTLEEQRETETDFESLISLIKRLGDPPLDVVDRWCQQLRESLQSSPRPIDKFDLADFEVASNGQIRFVKGVSNAAQEAGPASLESDQIDAFIDSIRHRLIPHEDSSTEKRGSQRWRKVAMVGGVVLCGGALLWIVRANSTMMVAESDAEENVSQSTASGNGFSEFPSTRSRTSDGGADGFVNSDLFDAIDNSLAGPDVSGDSLQTLESLEQTSDEEIAMWEADNAPQFSLADLIPNVPQPAPNDTEKSDTDAATQSFSPSESSNEQEGVSISNDTPSDTLGFQSADGAGASSTILSDDSLDGNEPDELQQPTRSAITASIKLPPIEQIDAVIIDDRFPSNSAETLTLGFPHSVDLSIQPKDDGSTWAIIDKTGSNVLANVGTEKNNLTFAWAESALKITGARSLHHGRITSGDGSAFFLRPEIEAEPWRIRLDQPDMRPTWELGAPLPPGVTRLSVDIDLPEQLEMTWVEPIPVDTPRRARGLAILKPLDGESVDLAIKFDVRCSRKLSCRLRYAARLDSSMPWQLVSRDLLEQFSNQLAARAGLVSREADRLQNVYDMAGTRGKRIIRIKQKYNDGLADSVRQYADRVAELQSLIASVESNAALRFHVWVLWPSGGEQTVFTSVSDENE